MTIISSKKYKPNIANSATSSPFCHKFYLAVTYNLLLKLKRYSDQLG